MVPHHQTIQSPPCPKCGSNQFIRASNPGQPVQSGDWIVCTNCTTACRVGEDLEIHECTGDEWETAEPKVREVITEIKTMMPLFRKVMPGAIVQHHGSGSRIERIVGVYAFVLKDPGGESIPVVLGPNGLNVPLITGAEANVESLRETAQKVSDELHQPLTLCKFSSREEVETIQPKQPIFNAENES